jgi:hypothetical protein
MRILLDADTPIQLLAVLRHLLPEHQVDHVHELGWSGKKDIPLLRDAGARYQVFVTNDANQLDNPDETAAIRRSRLHHVRYGHRKPGLRGLALAIGAVVAAMPDVVEHLENAESQRLVQVKGLDPNPKHRFESTDPTRHPPRYWQ